MGTLVGPTQGLTCFDGDSTNTGGAEVNGLLGTLEGQDLTETATGVSRAKALVRTREGTWDTAEAVVKQ